MVCQDLGPIERVLAVNSFLIAWRESFLKRIAQYNTFLKALSNVSKIFILDASTKPLICDILQRFGMAAVEHRKKCLRRQGLFPDLYMTALFPVIFWPIRHIMCNFISELQERLG
jgi:hypothetical protein